MTPNAEPQLLPEAGAQRTLEAVSCRRLFGSYAADTAVHLSLLWKPQHSSLSTPPVRYLRASTT
jgi:hypothetical protein